MISRKYKLLFDISNCIMIYLLGLALSIAATTYVRRDYFSWQYTIVSAIVLAAFVAMRLFIQQLPISIVAHAVVCIICYYIPFGNSGETRDWTHTLLITVFAVLLAVIDINDFYKKKNQSYGVLPVMSCLVFLVCYAYVAYAVNNIGKDYESIQAQLSTRYDLFSTIICLICIVFFALTLVRSYVANAIKLADNSQIDENAPVNYMYGNSNRFIGPIIALIIAVMLVAQSKASANILGSIWIALLSGVAGVCNLFSFLNSETTDSATGIAAPGTTLYAIEVIITLIIVAAIIIAIIIIVTKIYKSHWHKDISSDETLETAAMVEKREWIYHKETKKTVVEDTSVSNATEIPTEEEAVEETTEEK